MTTLVASVSDSSHSLMMLESSFTNVICLCYRPLISSVANVIQLFTTVSYDFSKKARAFVLGEPFQLGLMFVDKAGA